MAFIEMDFAKGSEGGNSGPELVWKNLDTTVQFAAQTINESSNGWISGRQISDYDGFIIAAANYISGAGLTSMVMTYITDVSDLTDISPYYKSACVHYNSTTCRDVELNSNGFVFSTATAGNNYNIPWYIWGVKGQLTEQ